MFTPFNKLFPVTLRCSSGPRLILSYFSTSVMLDFDENCLFYWPASSPVSIFFGGGVEILFWYLQTRDTVYGKRRLKSICISLHVKRKLWCITVMKNQTFKRKHEALENIIIIKVLVLVSPKSFYVFSSFDTFLFGAERT